MKTNSTRGFTIVELMIATVVFSMVLLLLATAIIFVGRVYYKGVATNRTQESARVIIDDMSQSIRFGNPSVDDSAFLRTATQTLGGQAVTSVCVGDARYTYVGDRSLGAEPVIQSAHVLWRDYPGESAPCTPVDLTLQAPSLGLSGQELVGENMRIPVFSICYGGQIGCDAQQGTWSLKIIVSYGKTPDLYESNSNFQQCVNSNLGGQFCSVSKINTEVIKRL